MTAWLHDLLKLVILVIHCTWKNFKQIVRLVQIDHIPSWCCEQFVYQYNCQLAHNYCSLILSGSVVPVRSTTEGDNLYNCVPSFLTFLFPSSLFSTSTTMLYVFDKVIYSSQMCNWIAAQTLRHGQQMGITHQLIRIHCRIKGEESTHFNFMFFMQKLFPFSKPRYFK